VVREGWIGVGGRKGWLSWYVRRGWERGVGGGNVLVQGYRKDGRDDYYREEWEDMGLKVLRAEVRDRGTKAGPK